MNTLSIEKADIFSIEKVEALKTNKIQIQDKPQWVKEISYEKPTEFRSDLKSGIEFLLDEVQALISADTAEVFSRDVQFISNESGLDNVSHFKVRFNPSYENIILHELEIIRNHERINLLLPLNIRVSDESADPHSNILLDRKIVKILLEDLRIGDILISSFTRVGLNPVFDNKFFYFSDLNFNVPVKRIYRNFNWNRERRIYAKILNSPLSPVFHDNMLLIDAKNIPAVILEDDIPSWSSPYGYLQLSECSNWNEIISWGCRHFASSPESSIALKEIAQNIVAQNELVENQIIAALHFVQNQIKYTALSFGQASHKPYSPELVLSRRFGDCKDKSLFLVCLLNLLGVKASVALVNTVALHTVEKYLPAPTVFNHAIVSVFWDDQIYWFDPTVVNQMGELKNRTQTLFGQALILNSEFLELTECNDAPLTDPNCEVHEVYKISDENLDEIYLEVNTIVRGVRADSYRSSILESSAEEINKKCLNYFLKFYKEIESLTDLDIQDDPNNNILQIKEKYLIKNALTIKEYGNFFNKSILVPAYEIMQYTYEPIIIKRSHPLRIKFPEFSKHHITIQLGSKPDLVPDELSIENEFLQFNRNVAVEGHEINWTQTLKTLKGSVLPNDIANHLKCLEDIYCACYLKVSFCSLKEISNPLEHYFNSEVIYSIPFKLNSVRVQSTLVCNGQICPELQEYYANFESENSSKNRVEYLKSMYGDIRINIPIKVNRSENGLSVIEDYLFEDFWNFDHANKFCETKPIADFGFKIVLSDLRIEMPVTSTTYQPHIDYRGKLYLNLSKQCKMDIQDFQISNQFFEFILSTEFNIHSKQCIISYNFRLMKRSISEIEAEEFNQELHKLCDATSWYFRTEKKTFMQKMKGIIKGALIYILGFLFFYVCFHAIK